MKPCIKSRYFIIEGDSLHKNKAVKLNLKIHFFRKKKEITYKIGFFVKKRAIFCKIFLQNIYSAIINCIIPSFN